MPEWFPAFLELCWLMMKFLVVFACIYIAIPPVMRLIARHLK